MAKGMSLAPAKQCREPRAPATKSRCSRDLLYPTRFLPLSLNGENLWPCILEYGRAQDQLGWAGCTSHKVRNLRHKRCWFPSRHLTGASCCAGVSLATAERSLLVMGPCCSPHLHPKLRSPEEERREGRGERENKRMRISLLFFFNPS